MQYDKRCWQIQASSIFICLHYPTGDVDQEHDVHEIGLFVRVLLISWPQKLHSGDQVRTVIVTLIKCLPQDLKGLLRWLEISGLSPFLVDDPFALIRR